MSMIAKTNELHGYLRMLTRAGGEAAFRQTTATLLLEQALLSLLCELRNDEFVDATTLEFALSKSEKTTDNWLVERIQREFYEPGHWLNGLRLARKQLLQPSAAITYSSSTLINISLADSTDPLSEWLTGFELLLAEAREFNTEY